MILDIAVGSGSKRTVSPTGWYGRGRRVREANSFGTGLKLSLSLFSWKRFVAAILVPQRGQRTKGRRVADMAGWRSLMSRSSGPASFFCNWDTVLSSQGEDLKNHLNA